MPATATTTVDDAGLYPAGTLLSGRYRIVSLLGKGGMGEVYLAEDLVLGEKVALKFLPEVAAAEPDLMERFVTEVRLARKVTHPNVARVHDIGEVDGRTFLSMEYVDGEDLGQLLRRIGRLPAEKALEISKQICEGLHAAHERGVLHRDLKPANVMLDGDGRVRLTDFGLAQLARDTDEGRLMGTPSYMSPEQITGGDCTVRSDLYSLGLLLYELFTGKRAFTGKSIEELRAKQQHEEPQPPSTILEFIDPVVEKIILRCIRKDPEERPTSARQVTLALPGGDPLAAALASGELPAPELVAAGAGDETTPVRTVTGLYGLWLAMIAALIVLAPFHRGSDLRSPDEKPPAVLRDRVGTLLHDVGWTTPPRDEADWYALDPQLVEARREDPAADLPDPLVYHYRRSPDVLVRRGLVADLQDPAPVRPGMVAVRTDATGRLLSLEALPDTPSDPTTAVPDAVWDRLFAAARLDRAALRDAEVASVPRVPADERHTWVAPRGAPWRVEAAGLAGRPVLFEVVAPGTDGRAGLPIEPMPDLVALGFLVILLVMSVLARHNVREGHSDRRGASRVAVFVFATHLVLWLGTQDHPGSLGGWFFTLVGGLGYHLFLAVTTWVIFLALEPTIRRRWPTALISWTRVLHGRFQDPLVGRDVLVGGAATLTLVAFLAAVDAALVAAGLPGAAGGRPATAVESVQGAIADVVHTMGDSLFYSMGIVLLIVVVRAVVKVPWLVVLVSATGFACLSSLPSGFALHDVLRDLALGLVFAALLTRYGVLALLTGVAVILAAPGLTPPLDAWDGHVAWVHLLALAGLATWAWRISLGERRVSDRRTWVSERATGRRRSDLRARSA